MKPAIKESQFSDNSIAYIALALSVLVTGFLLAWLFLKPPGKADAASVFFQAEALSFQVQDYTVRTTLALQFPRENGKWLAEHKKPLQNALQETLETLEPALIASTNSGKYQEMQNLLADAIHAKFPAAQIEHVWITDFLTSRDQ